MKKFLVNEICPKCSGEFNRVEWFSRVGLRVTCHWCGYWEWRATLDGQDFETKSEDQK